MHFIDNCCIVEFCIMFKLYQGLEIMIPCITSGYGVSNKNILQFLIMFYSSFVVPPEKPKIYEERGQEVRLKLGPYKIGDTILLKCVANGGKYI